MATTLEKTTDIQFADDLQIEAGLQALKVWPRSLLSDFTSREIASFFKKQDFPVIARYFPDFEFGDYAPIADMPDAYVKRFIHLGGRLSEGDFRENARAVIHGFFPNQEYGDGLLSAFDLLEELSRGNKRWTGEPEVFHGYRSVLNFLAVCHQSANNNVRISPLVKPREVMVFNSTSSSLDPFAQENQELVYAAAVAVALHDLREDYKEQGYVTFPALSSIVVLDTKRERVALRLKFPSDRAAKFCEIIIDACTRPQLGKGVVTSWESTQKQVEHGVNTITERIGNQKGISELEKLLGYIAKFCDRKDNLQTYYDFKPNVDLQDTAVRRYLHSQRIEKLRETLFNFYVFDEAAWMWQNMAAVNSFHQEIFSPQITTHCLLRLLGFTLDELFLKSCKACEGIMSELDKQGKKYVVVPDPFVPMILVEDGTAVMPIGLRNKPLV